jgi:Spy/CpxP family protein refolding chaperone
MNRRSMVILPGIAMAAASRGFAQAQETASGSGKLSHKAIGNITRLKSFSKIPKSAAKQAKYVNFLTVLLSLTENQRTQAAKIYASASASHAAVKQNMKAARQSLSEAVKSNNGVAIGKEAVAIGTLSAQYHAIGANAHATFFQTLTEAQQAKFNQFRG